MNLIEPLDSIKWNKLISDTADLFDDGTIQRGLKYFRQGRVLTISSEGTQKISGIVEGVSDYHVIISLASLSFSRCSCPVAGACKHMFAVLLEYAKLLEQPIDELIHAKETLIKKRLSNQAKIKGQAALIPTMSIPQWHELYALVTAHLDNDIRNVNYTTNVAVTIRSITPELPPVIHTLFELHIQLFLLERLVNPEQKAGRAFSFNPQAFIGYHTHLALTETYKKITEIFKRELTITDEPVFWAYMTDTLTYLRERIQQESMQDLYFGEPYDLLWQYWIIPHSHDTSMCSEELQHLINAQQLVGDSNSSTSLLIAQSRMYFYLSDDINAWKLLKLAVGERLTSEQILFYCPLELHKAEQWNRLTDWLIELAPLMKQVRFDCFDEYSLLWDSVVSHQPDVESQMWEIFIDMLPYSRSIYEEKLLTMGKWQAWIDHQISRGNEPLDERVTVYAPIEKNAPELLLPFYHQAVERYILLKNRDSYKLAVKLLKRLAKLYKKTKKEASWEQFFTTFTTRHSRLRALQEELRKGKLIP